MKKPKRLSIPELPDWRFGFFLFLAACARWAFGRDTLSNTPDNSFEAFRTARNLLFNGYFGDKQIPDAVIAPLYPTLLALLGKLGVEFDHKPYFQLNALLDLVAIGFFLAAGRRFQGGHAGFGLLFMALSPLWVAVSVFPNSLNLECALVGALFWVLAKPKRKPLDEVIAGALLGLLSLTNGTFYFFPAILAATLYFSQPTKKRMIPFGLLLPALLIPLPWMIRNLLLIGQPLIASGSLSPSLNFSSMLHFWFTGWSYPYATIWVPRNLTNLFLWVFLAFVPTLGAIGVLQQARDGKLDPFAKLLLALAAYLFVLSCFYSLGFFTSWLPYLAVSVFSGTALLRLCGLRVKQ